VSKLSAAWRRFVEHRFIRGSAPRALDAWQQAFCEWNAERLGIGVDESTGRFKNSWAAIKGGHSGRQFKLFVQLQQDVLQPFFGNREQEILNTYAAHGGTQFLRRLAQRVPVWPEHAPELRPVFDQPATVIADFGCGLAQTSISLAEYLQGQGRSPELFLADLPLMHKDFLHWFCHQLKLPITFGDCTAAQPIPRLPLCDVLIVREVFEHLHNPLAYLEALAAVIKPGGFLFTNVGDHEVEFLHVSPTMAPLREFLRKHGWRELRSNVLYQKAT
jgi:2-polyprenyl-3-methyl-5-hydroxy-6-metoxy-1,4-benzoquinol methylase